MIRYRIFSFLNRHTLIQYLFCFLPILLISIYMFAYTYDITRLASMFEYNNRLAKVSYDSSNLRRVDLIDKQSDNTYRVVVLQGDEVINTTVALGSPIYDITVGGSGVLKLSTPIGKSLYQSKTELFDVESNGANTYNINVGDKTFSVSRGAVVCSVGLSESGDYEVTYASSVVTKSSLDFISSLKMNKKVNNNYELSIIPAYSMILDSADTSLCTNLPTKETYYSEDTGSLIKNVSDDFTLRFITKSNILTLGLCMVVYILLLVHLQKTGELSVLKSKWVIRANLFGVAVLTLAIVFTFSLI